MANEEGKMKEIKLPIQSVVCSMHCEPFRYRWPAGFDVFFALSFQCLLSQKDFEKEVVVLCDVEDVDEVEAANKLLSEKPICCRLPKNDLLAVYLEVCKISGAFEVKTCSLCGRRGPGAPFAKVPPGTPLSDIAGAWPHVCFRCVCFAKAGPVRQTQQEPRIIVPKTGLNGHVN